MSVIRNYLIGWDELEPVILACVATGQNLMLLGKHGCGKSSIARFIADAHKENDEDVKMAIYHCDKETLITILGIPNPVALKDGLIEYATHNRSILHQDIIMLDELPRATKEGQNMFLEALQEKTIFGMPLKYKFVIATGNDETYKANYKLDPALLDRFYVVLPAPSGNEGGNSAEELKELIDLNLGKRKANIKESNKKLVTLINDIRKHYKDLLLNQDVRTNIAEFASRYFAVLKANLAELSKGAKTAFYIPHRIVGEHFPRLIMSIAAYFKAVGMEDEPLQKAAELAITYSLSTKLGLPIDKIMLYYEQFRDLLSEDSGEINRVKIALTTGAVSGRIETLNKHADLIKRAMEPAELVNAIGSMMQEFDVSKPDDMTNLKSLHSVVSKNEIDDTCKHVVELNVLNAGIHKGLHSLETWNA